MNDYVYYQSFGNIPITKLSSNSTHDELIKWLLADSLPRSLTTTTYTTSTEEYRPISYVNYSISTAPILETPTKILLDIQR